MKITNKITILLFMVALIQGYTKLHAAVDYSLDVSPAIKNQKMFSTGLGFRYSEYNGMFSDGTLYYNDLDNENISFISTALSIIPYFEYRPLSFLELGISVPFSYNEHEQYNSEINSITTDKEWSFDAIHSYAKIALIDWFISLGFRFDFSYNFSNTYGKQNNFDIYSKIFIAIVPKVIPVNILLNYQQGLDQNNLAFGIAQAAVELITSEILVFYVGANYLFPYTASDNTSSLEAFTKLSLFFDDFLSVNISYSKVFYGEGVGNNSTCLINVSYHF